MASPRTNTEEIKQMKLEMEKISQLEPPEINIEMIKKCGTFTALISSFLSAFASIMISININQQTLTQIIFYVAIGNIIIRIVQYFYLKNTYYSGNKHDPETIEIGKQREIQYLTLFTTYTECSFDILQAAVLVRGLQYKGTGDILVIIATWIGFSEECVDLFVETAEMGIEQLSKRSMLMYTAVILIMIIAEQILALNIRLEHAHWLGSVIALNSGLICLAALGFGAYHFGRYIN